MQGCESRTYFTDDGKCLVRKRLNRNQREQRCDSFIDKEFQPQVSGCCGIYNMPHEVSAKNNTVDDGE